MKCSHKFTFLVVFFFFNYEINIIKWLQWYIILYIEMEMFELNYIMNMQMINKAFFLLNEN